MKKARTKAAKKKPAPAPVAAKKKHAPAPVAAKAKTPAVKSFKNCTKVSGQSAFILSRDGLMRWQRAEIDLHVKDKTLVEVEIRRKKVMMISADGYRRLNEVTRVMPVQSPDILCEPSPPAPLDCVTVKGSAIGYTGGSVAVHNLVLRYDIRARLLHQLIRLASTAPEVARMGTKAGMFPAQKNTECWAFYPVDEATGVWIDLRSKDVLYELSKTQQVRTIADRYARTHWERNIIRTFMPGITMDVTRLYDYKTDTATVVMEGYYPDTVTDARDVQKKLVAIANGSLDALDAQVASFAMVVGNEIPQGQLHDADSTKEIEAVEEAESGESTGDPLTPPAESSTNGTMSPKQESNQEAAELIRAIDSELFFGVSVDAAQAIQKKYAPIAQQSVPVLREILAQLQASQVKK